MDNSIYFPLDNFGGQQPPNLDLAADYLELKAVLSEQKYSLSRSIIDALEMPADHDFTSVESEIVKREIVADETIGRIQLRKNILQEAYPIGLDESGETLSFAPEQPNLAHIAYLTSLLLSNLRPVSQVLNDFEPYPTKDDILSLRQYFQYIATTAIAAEIGGRAWSFGFPRPDNSGFIEKLTEIWDVIKDGEVEADTSAPSVPKDGGVDVFACREPEDGLPGYLIVAAQVATGKDWKNKSLLKDINHQFLKRWFGRQPVTRIIAYHVIPFARPDSSFRDDVLTVGNLLHRLRVPDRVLKAQMLVDNGVNIEGYDKLMKASG